MTTIILLDAGPLGLVTNPRASSDSRRCNLWLESVLQQGNRVLVPEITDYEVRRELLRAQKQPGIGRLDLLKVILGYLPLTTDMMLQAAEFWAQARQQGKPTADVKALDGDVILAAQAVSLQRPGITVVIATTNVGHLSRFTHAKRWEDITP